MQITSKSSIQEKMEVWARWRIAYIGGYGKSFLQRCLEGMPGTNCPDCHGKGYYLGQPTCPRCSGSGRVKLSSNTEIINPAFVRMTSYGGSNPILEGIDTAVSTLYRLHRRLYKVIWEQYCNGLMGPEKLRAERLRISCGTYSVYLSQAHKFIESSLDSIKKSA